VSARRLRPTGTGGELITPCDAENAEQCISQRHGHDGEPEQRTEPCAGCEVRPDASRTACASGVEPELGVGPASDGAGECAGDEAEPGAVPDRHDDDRVCEREEEGAAQTGNGAGDQVAAKGAGRRIATAFASGRPRTAR
jgi:hypothetical protein